MRVCVSPAFSVTNKLFHHGSKIIRRGRRDEGSIEQGPKRNSNSSFRQEGQLPHGLRFPAREKREDVAGKEKVSDVGYSSQVQKDTKGRAGQIWESLKSDRFHAR